MSINQQVRFVINRLDRRFRNLQRSELFSCLNKISEGCESRTEEYYKEAVNGKLKKIYLQQMRRYCKLYERHRLELSLTGFEKYARLDRLGLYCVVRILKPELVVETGVKWGEGSLCILQALEENGTGRLVSIDAGAEVAEGEYGEFPGNADEVGFFVPDYLRRRWDLRIGDSVSVLPRVCDRSRGVDLFYHDSLHTYSHMMSEYRTVLPALSSDGCIMSEDIDMTDAWDEFISTHLPETNITCRFRSLPGLYDKRIVGVARLKSGEICL